MAAAPKTQEALISIAEDPMSETGRGMRLERTPAWDSYGRGWSPEDCRRAGRVVAETVVAQYDAPPEAAFSLATSAAVQHPPLLGSRLAQFVLGAQEVLYPQGASAAEA